MDKQQYAEVIAEAIVKQLHEKDHTRRVLNPQLSDKVYNKYKRTIDKLVQAVGEEFKLHKSVVAIVLESVIRKFFGTHFRPGSEKKSNKGIKVGSWYADDMDETIKKVDGKYAVYPSKGGDRLGTHDTKKAAQKQLAAIEISKQKRK